MTIEEALNLIPTHIYLREGTWKDGDEFWDHKFQCWLEIQGSDEPDFINPDNFTVCRRPIPESIRKDMALALKRNLEEGVTSEFQDWLLSSQGKTL